MIDAAKSGLWGNFSDFFSTKATSLDVIGRPNRDLLAKLSSMSCFPRTIEGRLELYACQWSSDLLALVDSVSGSKLSFDFGMEYDEDVLVHHQAGGGPENAFALLKRIVLENAIAVHCADRLQKLSGDYDAIHIRNSDYKTEWQKFLHEVKSRLSSGSVLVCSDDIRVITFCRDFFNDKRLLLSSVPPDTGGKALHTHEFAMSAEQRRQVVIDGIVDLLALAMGRTLWYSSTTNGYPSGYSQLARLLHTEKSVIRSLLAGASSQAADLNLFT